MTNTAIKILLLLFLFTRFLAYFLIVFVLFYCAPWGQKTFVKFNCEADMESRCKNKKNLHKQLNLSSILRHNLQNFKARVDLFGIYVATVHAGALSGSGMALAWQPL